MAERGVDTALRFLFEMISILPAISLLIGLFAVFAPKQMVANSLGHTSGMKGFLTAWACIELPQEMVELQFMGLEFTLLRFSLTAVAAILMGLLAERLIRITDSTRQAA